jgi:3-deoxy-D-manno-octulosonic-acid transferase
MRLIYEIVIRLYRFSIILASVVNPKARGWVKGRQQIFSQLAGGLRDEKDKLAWFHCASLGEFEQGRPVIEKFRAHYPEYKILLTFFSPSGYEVRKNYPGADYIYYLPADTRVNAWRFYQIVKPDVLFLVKYEYWYNYIDILAKHDVPVFVISGIFRRSQHFFKWYGFWFRRHLRKVKYFFLQDEDSAKLLSSINVENIIVSGDTRFDRVMEIAEKSVLPEKVARFCNNKRVLVGGSTWPVDETFLAGALRSIPEDVKLILAPHEIDAAHIEKIIELFGTDSAIPYSSYIPEKNKHRILILDCIGVLSAVYRCASVAYVGGGFGKGMHNILEATAYGIPVIFGPNNKKFPEAMGLAEIQGGYEVSDQDSLNRILSELLTNEGKYTYSCEASAGFMNKNRGANEKVFSVLETKI